MILYYSIKLFFKVFLITFSVWIDMFIFDMCYMKNLIN